MLKCKATKKDLKESYYYIVSCGYCNTQYLLRREVPRFYYCNIYGWRFDVYEIKNNFIITDGYTYLETHKNQSEINNIIKKYDNKAKNILQSNNFKNISNKLNKNLEKCVNELKELIDNE